MEREIDILTIAVCPGNSVLLKILEVDLKQQPVYKDSPKDALSDLSLEIELVILFSPNQDSQDIPQQLQLGEFVHYHPSE
ncbi:hypothetical protein TNCV_2452251 [Trichonephila clavipes]|nr:hypothetical protein TNCV_2452251 [Trichonephila clavipes]